MILPTKSLEILCCPKRSCRGDLREIKKGEEVYLKCFFCGDEYPIIDGIPIIFPNAAYSPDIHKRHWDQETNAFSYAKKYNAYLKKEGAPWGLYTHNSEMSVIKKLARGIDLAGKTILDCGCGNGRLLTLYPEAGMKIGIDASLLLLQAAQKREPDFFFVCGQLEDMPFKDAIADFSVSVRVFQHLKVPEHAFAEMVRVTKPSGHVALELYNKLNLKELYKRFRMLKWMEKIKPWGLSYDRYYSFREIEKWCRDNFVKTQKYAGAGWGVNFYLFEPIKFRRLAPDWLQKFVYDIFLRIENAVGTWPFFSKTMEKVCIIGSLQAKPRRNLITKVADRMRTYFDVKRALRFEGILKDRNYCFVSDDKEHLTSVLYWFKRAQDATADSGISRGWSFLRGGKSNESGWQSSYPETTGYIIPTFIAAFKFFNDEDLLRRARLMADWEINIMFPDGAVHGGNIAQKPNRAVFDTGQVIRGLMAVYNETKNEKYLAAAQKSARWILGNEYNKEGRWIENNAACVNPYSTTYNTFLAAPVAELGKISGDKELQKLGMRVGRFALKAQNMNGWFEGADFANRPDALLHTIAYTIDGLWDLGEILEEKDFSDAAKRALERIILRMDERGRIPGRLNYNWEGDTNWCCLTGIAQIGVTCMKVFNKTREKKYFEAAKKAKEFLKTCQNNIDDSYGGGKGAIWGSWPISGEYGKFEAFNWPAKFFADLLFEFVSEKK